MWLFVLFYTVEDGLKNKPVPTVEIPADLKAADKNKDGVISTDEIGKASGKRYFCHEGAWRWKSVKGL